VSRVNYYIAELRAPFFTGSLLPVALGTAVAYYHSGAIDWVHLAIAFVGVATLHAGSNVMNDYFDHKSGCDEANSDFVRPFTGGSRLIQKGILSPKEVFIESIVLFAVAIACGIYLTAAVGWLAFAFGAIGAASGYFYTAPPLRLCARGLGEIVVGVNFGVLVTLGSYYIQTAELNWMPVVASLPLAVLIAAVLYINQFQDVRADSLAGKRNLVVRLGRKRAAWFFAIFMLLPYVAVTVAVSAGAVPSLSLLALFALPISVRAFMIAKKHHSDSRRLVPANVLTIAAHFIVAVMLGIGYCMAS
jgi:1,4-dihydroxy-2-naphthoate octaprenyltransferase